MPLRNRFLYTVLQDNAQIYQSLVGSKLQESDIISKMIALKKNNPGSTILVKREIVIEVIDDATAIADLNSAQVAAAK